MHEPEEMMSRNNLVCNNDGQPTRRESTSVIDLVLSSAEFAKYSLSSTTLTHEKIRSDHIAVLLEADFDVKSVEPSIRMIRPVKKADWGEWKEVTENKFENFVQSASGILEEDYPQFCELLNQSMDEVIPLKSVNLRKLNQHPCWWNSAVSKAKSHLNYCQKQYKLRSTIQNKENLISAETDFENTKQKAEEEWANDLIDVFQKAKTPQERWTAYHKMTDKQTNNTILPLIHEDRPAAFANSEKCEILQEVFFEGSHLKNNQFDTEFYSKITDECSRISRNLDLSEDIDGFNDEISLTEVESAIELTKIGKSPGPDSIYAEFFHFGGSNLKEAVLYIFNLSWTSGTLPEAWKEALVKFLRKHGKSDYYSPSSYRPISLTSTLCKIMERIILSRLEGYVEGKNLMDVEQEGFRRYHCTTYAVLKLVQAIREGFNSKERTAACFIDLEKAYDSVWREGLMVKLANLGIKGRLWGWIYAFLTERQVTCSIGTSQGQTAISRTGLPQGSVISPLLFNVFIRDMFQDVTGSCCKFADDGTLWHRGTDLNSLIEKVCADVLKIQAWCNRWRMKLSLNKTEVTVFQWYAVENTVHDMFKIGDKSIKYNPTPKILGITLDEQLSFSAHVSATEKKASRALHVIREVKGISRISSKNLIQLYVAMVRPIIEYGCTVWQTVTQTELKSLEGIQKKALALCLSLPGTAALDALEVAAGIPPLDLRFCEIATRDMAKIAAKKQDYPLKLKLDQYSQDSGMWNEKFVSPVGLAVSQINEMKRSTGTGIEFIQPEPDYRDGAFVRCIERPSYWSQLGSSKNRTSVQEEMGREIIQKLVEDVSEECILCFTDGSCIPNPGPCGAGAVIYTPNEMDIHIKKPVAAHGSILLAELVAILSVLEHFSNIPSNIKNLRLFSDSQTAVGIITLNWSSNSYCDVTRKINSHLQQFRANGWKIEILWTPGHTDIQGNEVADELAKEAALEAKELDIGTSVITHQDIKKAARSSILEKWQNKWEISNTGRELFQYKPQIDPKPKHDYPNHKIYSVLLQLRTGYSQLNEYRSKLGQIVSNLCLCGQVETTEHYLLECE
ncbi:MAG: reverse transcriptase domain-containing protein, partial [Candidatus Thiodiazotropha sp.]